MDTIPRWQAMRISHLDLMLAWEVCSVASRHGGAMTKVASDYGLSPSIVQKALGRVEVAMGGRAFFVMGKKRTSTLSPDGTRFLLKAAGLIGTWNVTLSAGTLD